MPKQSPKGNGHPVQKIEIRLELSQEQGAELLNTLKERFEKHMNRHEGLAWAEVQAKLEAQPEKLASLNAMESTGGEPDVVGQDKKTGETKTFVYAGYKDSPDRWEKGTEPKKIGWYAGMQYDGDIANAKTYQRSETVPVPGRRSLKQSRSCHALCA